MTNSGAKKKKTGSSFYSASSSPLRGPRKHSEEKCKLVSLIS